MLVIDAVAFAHPGQETPYRFDLEVLPGDISAVTGASGSGKSTLLDLIAGFLRPAGGTIRLDGADLTGKPPEARPVSILFQDDNLFDHLNVDANLELGLSRSMPREMRRRAMDDALQDVGLKGLGARRAANLSGGQKQRVALARTLLRDRPVLLLDEPFTGLDPDTAAAMRDLVKSLTQTRGWHTVLVSHDVDDVAALASRRYVMRNAELVRAD